MLATASSTLLRDWILLPQDPRLLEEHRQTVLLRTRVAALIALVVIPLTIFSYFSRTQAGLELSIQIVIPPVIGVLLVLAALRTRFWQRHYSAPFFFLVGVVCAGTEAVLVQVADELSLGPFLFPYFLIMFGIATLFPASLAWSLAAALMCPISFVVSELIADGGLEAGQPVSNLILLGDYVIIAVIGSRVTTRLFFSELEHRYGLERANERLRQLDRARSDLLAGISHDLRNPLNNIIAPLTAVSSKAEELPPGDRRFVELALRGAKRMDSMIGDLLELARLESGAAVLHIEHLDLRDLIASLLESTRPYAASLGHDLRFRSPDHPVWIVADGEKLERVFVNLLSNALKYSRPNTSISVQLRDEHARVIISVVDQGPGIPKTDLERIFTRYTRLGEPATSHTSAGAGLGLAIVKEFVTLHEGEVQVESVVGQGSTFSVILPRSFAQRRPTIHAHAS